MSATFILFSTTTGASMSSYKVYFQYQYNPYYCIVKAHNEDEARSQARKEQGFIWIYKVIKVENKS
jgi:hypothetical protein